MPLYPELTALSFPQLITAFEQPRHPDGLTFYQEVAIVIRTVGDLGLGYLLGKLSASRIIPMRSAILGLTFPPVQEPGLAAHIQHTLRQYIQHRHAIIAMDAIDTLRLLGDRTPTAAVLASATHPSAYVRGAVVRYVAELVPEQIPAIVLPALQDPHYIVRESAIDALDEIRWVDTAEAVRPYLTDPHPDVRQAAATALEHLSYEEK
jgi:hypothetical protein